MQQTTVIVMPFERDTTTKQSRAIPMTSPSLDHHEQHRIQARVFPVRLLIPYDYSEEKRQD
jgi:acyl-ACP thioesterase